MNASLKLLNTIIKLRRDNDYNYAKVKDTFIPAKGEVCLVDTAKLGLCAVVGDGVSTYGSLEYINTIFQKVTFVDGKPFVDGKEIEPNENKIYIDVNNPNDLYYYNGENVDGTMTQKAITDSLKSKVGATVEAENEIIIFR